jgi:hypothetical protein
MNERATSELERFARAAAQLADPFVARARVLASLGLDESAWAALAARWQSELEGRAAAGDHAPAAAFREAFAGERRRLDAARAAERRPQPAPGAARAPAAMSIDSTAVARAVLEPALPFVGRSPEPPPAAAGDTPPRPEADLDATEPLGHTPFSATLPFDTPALDDAP